MTPEQFLEDVRIRFGDGAQTVAAMWVRSQAVSTAMREKRATHDDIIGVLKQNLMDVVRLTKLSSDEFRYIVDEAAKLFEDDITLH